MKKLQETTEADLKIFEEWQESYNSEQSKRIFAEVWFTSSKKSFKISLTNSLGGFAFPAKIFRKKENAVKYINSHVKKQNDFRENQGKEMKAKGLQGLCYA
jgi:hypothetical protein